MKYLLLMLLFCSCLTLPKDVRKKQKAQAKVLKLVSKYDLKDTFEVIVKDTIYVGGNSADTIFVSEVGDTIKIDTGRLHVRIVRLAGDKIYVHAECDPDTIHTEKTVFVERPYINTREVWAYKLFKKFKRWWILLVITAICSIIYALLKKFKVL